MDLIRLWQCSVPRIPFFLQLLLYEEDMQQGCFSMLQPVMLGARVLSLPGMTAPFLMIALQEIASFLQEWVTARCARP